MAALVYHVTAWLRHKTSLESNATQNESCMKMHLRPNHRGKTALLLVFVIAIAPGWPRSSPELTPFRSAIPAGYEIIQLQPSGAVVSLLALVECPEIEGAQHVDQGLRSRIQLADGAELRHFPRHFSFRVTASLRKTVMDPPSSSLAFQQDPAEFLLGLKFRLRAYDALVSTDLSPESVTMIGVPADVPYDERVFRVNFDVGNRAVTDRFVLQVYSPAGNRVGRFSFELL